MSSDVSFLGYRSVSLTIADTVFLVLCCVASGSTVSVNMPTSTSSVEGVEGAQVPAAATLGANAMQK